MAGAGSLSRSKVTSCVRCKKRKSRCDSGFPSCNACAKAGVECQGYNSKGQEPLPRSLVRSLESQVAELEKQLAKVQGSASNIALACTSRLAFSTHSALKSPPGSRPFFLSNISSLFFLHPSCPPLWVSKINPRVIIPTSVEAHSQTLDAIPNRSLANLTKIPQAATEHMVWNYANIHHPQYPCLQMAWLDKALSQVLQTHIGDSDLVLANSILPASQTTHFEFFVVFIVLAISSLTLTWKNESQARLSSNAFFASAIDHLRLVTDLPELQRLQISLLLAHYAHMNPGKVDNWICIWDAARIVLELRLHTRTADKLVDEQARLENHLFWVTYGMERSMCATLRLPLSIPEDAISAIPDLELQDVDADGEKPTKSSSAIHLCHYRRLETEVYRVLYLQDALPDKSTEDLDIWITDINSRLDQWLLKAEDYAKYQMFEFRHVQYSFLKAKTFCPTPRLEIRSIKDRQVCFDSCSVLVEDYQKQLRSKRLFYPWHAVNILFETALILLDACWALRDEPAMQLQARQTLAVTVPDCLYLLSRVGDSWPDAGLCSRYLEPIVDEVGEAFRIRMVVDVNVERKLLEENISAKLRRLLFPDGPLFYSPRLPSDSGRRSLGSSGEQIELPEPPSLDDFDWDVIEWGQLQGTDTLAGDSII